MSNDDEAAFYTLLLDTDEAIRPGSKARTPGAMNLVFDDLRQYPLELVAKALTAHRRDPERGQWLPNSSHIEHQINIRRPVVWLTADEAWSRAPKIEAQPALMTNEMAQALAAAAPLLADRDKNAARMAFRATYERLVERAKLERRGPMYFVSPGGTFEEMHAVEQEGFRLGLLAPPSVVAVPLIENKPRTAGAKPDLKALLGTMQLKTMPKPERQDRNE